MLRQLLELVRQRFTTKSPDLPEITLGVLVMLTDPPAVTLTCAEVFALLDQYAERAARGEAVAHLMPLVQAHLDLCPDCRELYDALLKAITAG